MFGGNDKMPQDKMPRDEMAQKSPHPEMYCNDWLTINWYGGYRLKAGTGLCIIVFVHIMCAVIWLLIWTFTFLDKRPTSRWLWAGRTKRGI